MRGRRGIDVVIAGEFVVTLVWAQPGWTLWQRDELVSDPRDEKVQSWRTIDEAIESLSRQLEPDGQRDCAHAGRVGRTPRIEDAAPACGPQPSADGPFAPLATDE